MEKIFYENEQTKAVASLRLDGSHQMIVFGSDTSQLNSATIDEQVQAYQDRESNRGLRAKAVNSFRRLTSAQAFNVKFMPVTVRVLEVSWLANNLRDLYVFMAGVSDDQVFSTELMKVLLG